MQKRWTGRVGSKDSALKCTFLGSQVDLKSVDIKSLLKYNFKLSFFSVVSLNIWHGYSPAKLSPH